MTRNPGNKRRTTKQFMILDLNETRESLHFYRGIRIDIRDAPIYSILILYSTWEDVWLVVINSVKGGIFESVFIHRVQRVHASFTLA